VRNDVTDCPSAVLKIAGHHLLGQTALQSIHIESPINNFNYVAIFALQSFALVRHPNEEFLHSTEGAH
jgi:hypothetical protein